MGMFDSDFGDKLKNIGSGKILSLALNPGKDQFGLGLASTKTTWDFLGGKMSANQAWKRGAKQTEKFGKTAVEQAVLTGAVTHLGAASHLIKQSDDDGAPPPAGDLPAQGAGVTGARQEARRRALERSRGRFGLSKTVATTPLGLTGDGAALGKKRLIGE